MIFRGALETWRWMTISPAAMAATVLFVALFLFGLQLLTSFTGAAVTTSTLFWVLSFADHVKVAKLGVPATPTDLLLSQQYLEVSYMMWGHLAYVALAIGAILAVAVIWLIYRRAKRAERSNSTWVTIAQVVVIAGIIGVISIPDYNYYSARYRHSPVADMLDSWGIHNRNFDPLSNATSNGQLLAFLMNVRAAMIHPPEGYNADKVIAALAAGTSTPPSAASQPDVVVIMSEAFWDPGELPGVTYSDPLLHAARTSQRGSLFSPVFGGYTSNTEFEFLTRVSNGILPTGSIPYVQYVTRPTLSLANDFTAAGYEAIALHPFDGNFWNRRKVYKDFGFQSFDDRETFVHRDMTGPFINDHALAEEINMKLDGSPGPHFVFAVSLQSHAPYTGGMYRYINRVTVNDDARKLSDDAKDQLSTYASGVRDAVASFNQVVDHAEKSGRKTIVVMFGDHLPALGDDYMLYKQTGFLKVADPSQWTSADQERMHTVPLLVWSNSDARLDLPEEAFSPIYLGYRIKQMAGINLNNIDALMHRMASAWPIISQVYSKDSSGRTFRGMPQGSSARDYALVAYDLLLGKQYARSEETPTPVR